MELIDMNEIEYSLSMDLKLTNITIGIGPHSSKYPCPYGECFRNENGEWTKGRDRTVNNIKENRAKWIHKSKNIGGNRKLLKDFMNCESDPLINGDPDCPIIKIIPPPPLHIVLLGTVNHIFKEFEKRYPKILERVSKSRALLK